MLPSCRAPSLALLLGAALLAAPVLASAKTEGSHPSASAKKATTKAKSTRKDSGKKSTAKKEAKETKPGPLADFRGEAAPDEVVHVANWVSYTRNNKKKAFVVIDKKKARMWVFDPQGKLRSDTPVLLGKAIGDTTAPGVGNKPLSQLKEEEKTTPAGRFLATPGKNTRGHDIIWIDYDAAVSMHRLLKVGDEHRAERMASETIDDNRISNGCVNVPPKFYNAVLKPTVTKYGAYVYVLPETRTPQQLFGSYDVPKDKGTQVAATPPSPKAK